MAATLIALMLHAGDPGSIDWWWTAIPFGLWIVGPAVLPWGIARIRPRPGVALVMLVFLVASSIMSGSIYCDAFFRSTSSTAALVLVFVPLLQWVALAIVAIIAVVATSRVGETAN
ncbi:hypothetical protein [Sphingomonas koreensis]